MADPHPDKVRWNSLEQKSLGIGLQMYHFVSWQFQTLFGFVPQEPMWIFSMQMVFDVCIKDFHAIMGHVELRAMKNPDRSCEQSVPHGKPAICIGQNRQLWELPLDEELG